jgi:hypothetical protein
MQINNIYSGYAANYTNEVNGKKQIAEDKGVISANSKTEDTIKKLGSYLKNATYGASDVSDFSKSLLERYAASGDK